MKQGRTCTVSNCEETWLEEVTHPNGVKLRYCKRYHAWPFRPKKTEPAARTYRRTPPPPKRTRRF